MPIVFPTERECMRFYGKPGTNHVAMQVPYPMTYDGAPVKFISINKKCADSAHAALSKIASEYSASDRKALGLSIYAGCYNPRPKRGGTEWSMHAFACAIDFDPGRNQLKWGKEGSKLANGKVINVPRLSLKDCEPFWRAWEEQGWLSLGRARNFDWMHVQAARL